MDNVQPSAEIRAVAAGPDSRDPLPAVSGPVPAPQPLQAASKQERPLADHGQVSVVQGEAPAEHDQALVEQGQALAGHGRASAGQESDLPPRGSLRPVADLGLAPVAAPGTEGFGHIPPGPGQPVPVDMADGRQYPAEGTVFAAQSPPATQPAGASQTRPTLEPESSDAGQTLQPLARSEQPDRSQSPAGDKTDRAYSTGIQPDVGSPIQPALQPTLTLSEQPGRPQPPAGDKTDRAYSAGIQPGDGSPIRPVLQPLPGTADRPASPAPPARPTIEITIGRVEVRLRPEATWPPQPASRPKPTLSLDDYLSRQGRGR
jgi:hypothetical protein